jgi:hypothetical protein
MLVADLEALDEAESLAQPTHRSAHICPTPAAGSDARNAGHAAPALPLRPGASFAADLIPASDDKRSRGSRGDECS